MSNKGENDGKIVRGIALTNNLLGIVVAIIVIVGAIAGAIGGILALHAGSGHTSSTGSATATTPQSDHPTIAQVMLTPTSTATPTVTHTPTSTPTSASGPPYYETALPSGAPTFTNYMNAGGTQGTRVQAYETIEVACRLTGWKVQDGNTWWYRLTSNPWNNTFYASADDFYNDGQTSGDYSNTPFVDTKVPLC